MTDAVFLQAPEQLASSRTRDYHASVHMQPLGFKSLLGQMQLSATRTDSCLMDAQR